MFSASTCPPVLPPADLVIDAAYGTGFHGSWDPPDVGDAAVLAVDIPSGVDGLTGHAEGAVLAADRTITFAALKPGLLFSPGAELAGELELADIGLEVPFAHAQLVQRDDVGRWWLIWRHWRSRARIAAILELCQERIGCLSHAHVHRCQVLTMAKVGEAFVGDL
ncbi:MAG: hypothetical protein H7Y19_11005, partial [Luteimonas sp.]|nr:hypothetical protein [Luteimonas sp.]